MANKWLNLFPDAERTKADFYLDGEAAYRAMIEAIDTAESADHYIYILGWMLDIDLQLSADNPDSSLYKLLSRAANKATNKAANKGVEIRILIWDNPTPELTKMANDAIPRLNKLSNTKAFIDEYTFSPARSKALLQKIAPFVTRLINYVGLNFMPMVLNNADLPFMNIIYRGLGLINLQTIGAHHEKVTIVKGKAGLVAFCGGIDYNENRVYTTIGGMDFRIPYLHDVACRLQGPAAYDVLQKFKLRWNHHPQASRETLLGADEQKAKPANTPYPYCTVVGTYNSQDGREKIRSLKKAYLDIIDSADKFIYIEDQYLVNIDVAKHINARLKRPSFERAIFVIQGSEETADIFIPNRKRGKFLDALTNGLSNGDKEKKILLALFDKRYSLARYHPAMHAKTLIVDDEIAIIGSANVNQRSFTNDSETSVVVFDDNAKTDNNFARVFRLKTWEEYVRNTMSRSVYESWVTFSDAINGGKTNFEITKYVHDSQDDLDVRINNLQITKDVKLTQLKPFIAAFAYNMLDQDLLNTSIALSPYTVTFVFDTLWDNLIDPNAD